MKTPKPFNLASLAVVAALGAAAPAFANHPPVDPNLGTPVHEGSADRTLVVDPAMKWVNVTNGETIKFVINGARGEQSFAWRFDTYTYGAVIELNKLAPAGMFDRAIKVYVAPNPQDISG